MIPKIGLIDYGMGNLHSVQQAFKRLGNHLEIINSPVDLYKCNSLILPGVGSFDPAMENLEKTGLIPFLKKWATEGKPLLGICLGLQLLFESSEEGNNKGLGILEGSIKKLPKNNSERVPHMGWSLLNLKNECPLLKEDYNQNWMYFVHSFSAKPKNKAELVATTKFGNEEVTAIVWKDNIGACQFHPEKSGDSGRLLLSNWLNWLINI